MTQDIVTPAVSRTPGAFGLFLDVFDTKQTWGEVEANQTAAYLKAVVESGERLTPATVERELVNILEAATKQLNVSRDPKDRVMAPRGLSPACLADVLIALEGVVLVAPALTTAADRARMLVAIYDDDPASEGFGTYRSTESDLRTRARGYSRHLTTTSWSETRAIIVDRAPIVTTTADPDLVPMNNGVLNYRTKVLADYSPEMVYLSKSPVDWNPEAENPIINTPHGDTWDVETWMAGLSDDPEVVELLWQVTGAALRPYVAWNQSAWYYSKRGNNGKGTLMEMQRNLVGAHRVAKLSLKAMSDSHKLVKLVGASAVMSDENDVGAFIEEAANLKEIITQDAVEINPKHQSPYDYRPFVFVIQCLNDMPAFRDRSDSFYRRQLFIPFTKWFGGEGVERTYIKHDYLKRKDVLEYVAKRVLSMDYYKLSHPESCRVVLEEYKNTTDPVRDFWRTIEPNIANDVWTQNLLYAVWQAWCRSNAPKSENMSASKLMAALDRIVSETGDWKVSAGKQQRIKAEWMTQPEPMVRTLGLTEWVREDSHGRPRWDTGPCEGRACGPRTQGTLERVAAPQLPAWEAANRLVKAQAEEAVAVSMLAMVGEMLEAAQAELDAQPKQLDAPSVDGCPVFMRVAALETERALRVTALDVARTETAKARAAVELAEGAEKA